MRPFGLCRPPPAKPAAEIAAEAEILMAIDPVGSWISGPRTAFSDGYASEFTPRGMAPCARLQRKVLTDLSGWLLQQGMVEPV
jgi:hypothetical protein